MPIAPELQRFVDDELTRAPALIARVTVGMLKALREGAASETGPSHPVADALQADADAYQRRFVSALTTGVRQTLAEQSDGLRAEAAAPAAGLQLMDESRVEIDIEISRASQLIDSAAEWELRELQTFTSTLIGQSHVSAESNPFRPLAYTTALWKAACAVSSVQAQRTALLRCATSVAAKMLKTAWAAACTRLESQGVVPGVYRTVLLPSNVPGRNASGANSARVDSMSDLLSSMPSGTAPLLDSDEPGRPRSLAFEQALIRLDELLRRLPAAPAEARAQSAGLVKRLNLHRVALIENASSFGERQAIELLGRIFDSILGDPQLPASFATVLARLQTSALRVALRDPQVLTSPQHEVWKLLDRIGEVGAAQPLASDPRASAVLELCHALAERLAQAPSVNAASYRRALQHLDALLAEQIEAQLHAAQSSVAALQLAERRSALERQLAQRLTEQMAPMRTRPRIRRFVLDCWSKVLAEAMLRFGEHAAETRGHIRLVDELLWSVQLPDHPQSRQRLIALLPGMLERLRAGMALIALPAAEEQAVLAELMTIHTEALRPGGRTDTDALTPEQIVQRMREEVLPPTTGQGSFSDSVIDLASMETVPAELMSEAPAGDSARGVETLRRGDRLRLFLNGRWARVQLLWRSDQGLFLLFADENPGRTHSITQRALEKLAAAGLLQPLETRTLVQRALDNLTRNLTRPA